MQDCVAIKHSHLSEINLDGSNESFKICTKAINPYHVISYGTLTIVGVIDLATVALVEDCESFTTFFFFLFFFLLSMT